MKLILVPHCVQLVTHVYNSHNLDPERLDLIESRHRALHRVIIAAVTDCDQSYLVYMATRPSEMRRLLKLYGSVNLHSEPTMSHYLKLVKDAIFGRRQLHRRVGENCPVRTAKTQTMMRRGHGYSAA